MEAPDYTIDDFREDMGPLQWMEPRTTDDFWVFWSQEGVGEGGDTGSFTETLGNNIWENVKEYFKSAHGNNVLIQFWVPTTTTSSTTGGRCILTTSNQPFVLYRIERGLCEYRKHCTSLECNVFQDENEEEDEDEFGSVIGRVFRDKEAESTDDDGLLGDFAHKCGIRISFFLPLFKPSSRCCFGVLEISDNSESTIYHFYRYRLARDIFREANFVEPPELQESTEIEEINKALQGVCTTHQLPLAQIWIPCCTSTAMAYVDSPGERCHSPYLCCSNKYSSSISQNGDADVHCAMKTFNSSSTCYDIIMGQGIVGKALLYKKPCFCRDVNQLPVSKYPLSNVARFFGFSGYYAIWLQSTRTNNHDYVLECFLPPWNTISGDPRTYLELLLATVKKQLPGFKIGSVGEESRVEICEIYVNDDEPDSIMIPQTTSVQPVPESFANEKETVQNEVVGEITIRPPPMPESLQNENEVVQQLSDDEPTMEEAVRKNELNAQTSVAVTSSERIFSRAEASEREYRTANITLSREDLTKHFGKKLDDAARILKVSRSTMKRALRHHNIDKWPAPKRKKVNALRVRSGNEGIEGTYKGDPSCSDPPPTPTTTGISHKTSNSRQEHDVGNVTIKATHGNKTFRFKLPFLSRKTDLVDKLTTRLSLNEESFNIEYQDEENEWISIECDEDLEECIGIWKGKSIIKMLVEPITNQAT